MDLVSNFVGGLSASQFGSNTQSATSNFDMNDTTFADLLNKQLNQQDEAVNSISNTALNILDFNNKSSFEATNINPISNVDNTKDMSTSEVLTMFNSLFESKPTLTDSSNSGLFQFEKKFAASQYGKYARNVITDLNEFVSDAVLSK